MENINQSSPARAAAAVAIIVIATLAALWPVVPCDFVSWDDLETVAQNPNVFPASSAGVMHIWTHGAMGLYVPVTYTAWTAIGWIAGPADVLAAHPRPDPMLFHAANLLVHVLSALLVFAIVRRIVRNDIAACVGALLFALHPVQVEAVAWVSGLKDLLSAFFSLVAIWQYLAFVLSPAESSSRIIRYLIVLAAAGLAMLSKPSAMALPVVLLVLDALVLRRNARQVIRAVLPVIAICLPCTILAMVIQHPPRNVALWQRPIVVLDSISFYAVKLFWPVKLALDYGRRPADALHDRFIWFCWVIPLALVIVLWMIRRRASIVFAGVLIFLVIVSPTLGLVNTLYQDKSTVANHYLYFAMFGMALALAAVVARLRSPVLVACAAVVLVACGALSFRQSAFWRDSCSIFSHTVAVSPRSWASRIGLAQELVHRKEFDQAQQRLQEAVDIYPSSRTFLSLGECLLVANKPADAIAPLKRALQYEPDIPNGQLSLATAYAQSGHRDDAKRELTQLLHDHPDDAQAAALLRTLEVSP